MDDINDELQIAYQRPDFSVDELGTCNVPTFIEFIKSKNWLQDLMRFSSLTLIHKSCCPPNFSACIGQSVNITITPADADFFSVIFRVKRGTGFFARWTTKTHHGISIDRLAHLLNSIKNGDWEALELK
ncbi:MAG: hypothetical protein AAGI37_04195 [Planctomycetota bacterium]